MSTATEVLARMAALERDLYPRIARDMAVFGRAVLHTALEHKTPCIKYGRSRRRKRRVFPLGAKLLPPVEIIV